MEASRNYDSTDPVSYTHLDVYKRQGKYFLYESIFRYSKILLEDINYNIKKYYKTKNYNNENVIKFITDLQMHKNIVGGNV